MAVARGGGSHVVVRYIYVQVQMMIDMLLSMVEGLIRTGRPERPNVGSITDASSHTLAPS